MCLIQLSSKRLRSAKGRNRSRASLPKIRWTSGFLVEGSWFGAGGVKGNTRKPKESVNLPHRGLQRLNQQPRTLLGTDLGFLPVCYSCAIWSSCGTPNSRSRSCFLLCCLLWGPFHPTILPHPVLRGSA